jgi:cellulose synthase operon protein YhjQ
MSDRKSPGDQNDTPEDVATLYSWANLHGAKYRDFSASRAETRENARQRAQQAIENEHQQTGELNEAGVAVELQRATEQENRVDTASEAETQREAILAVQRAARQAAQEAEQRMADEAAQRAAQEAEERIAREAAQRAAQQARQRDAREAAQQQDQQEAVQPPQNWQQPRPDRFAAMLPQNPVPQFQQANLPGYAQQPQAFRPSPNQPSQPSPSQPNPLQSSAGQSAAQAQVPAQTQSPAQKQADSVREETAAQPRNPWTPPDLREGIGRPAWLTPDRTQTTPQSAPAASQAQASEDTLQGSRDRLASRWFALRGVFSGDAAPVETAPAPVTSRAPVMAVFSLAGGVGKTSVVATLGRALAARGERVLLVDTAAFGLLPFFFGARDQRPGLLRTFSPPGVSSDAPIQMVTIDPEAVGPETAGADAAGQNALSAEITRYARGGVSRVIVDLATASGATTRKVMRMAPIILVPVAPDMNSVVSVSSIDHFFEHNSATGAKTPLYYVLNQFDAALPLHLDVREILRQQLGDRLLPFALRRSPAVSEALAEGMTVMDYAPNSTVAEDFGTLAGWVKSLSAPANTSYRGVRWSER